MHSFVASILLGMTGFDAFNRNPEPPPPDEVWLLCEMTSAWDSTEEHFETRRFSIRDLVPVELLHLGEIRLPPASPRTALRPYAERLNALREAEQVYDMLSRTGYEMERAVPDERLALADRLWFGKSDDGPFFRARQAWRRLEEDLESVEQSLDAEKAELCRDVLGIEMGDIVIVESRGKAVRLQVEDASAYVSESDVVFLVHGTRFRKDGTLGKRQESFTLRFDKDEG